MLGRDVGDVRDGTAATKLAGARDDRRRPSRCCAAERLTRRHVLDDVSVDVRAGRGRRPRRPARLGPHRDRQGHLRRAARSTPARSRSDGAALRTGTPAAAIRAGIAMLPEDRKAEGIIPDLSVRDNIALAALPRLVAPGWSSDARRSTGSSRPS